VKTITDLAVQGYERDRLFAEAKQLIEHGQTGPGLPLILAQALNNRGLIQVLLGLSRLVRWRSRSSHSTDLQKKVLLGIYQLGRDAASVAPVVRAFMERQTDPLMHRLASNALAQIEGQ
jgi:hypothetical protein